MRETLSRFADVAERYCRLVESYDGADWPAFQHSLRRMLAELIHEGYRLPDVGGESDDLEVSVAHDEWQRVLSKLKSTMAVQEYWMVFTPTDHDDHDPVCADLADDLADIWRDLQVGLKAMQQLDTGIDPASVIWEWRFNFYAHWGSHAIAALGCLHRLGSSV